MEKLRKSQAFREYQVEKKADKAGRSNTKTAASREHEDSFEDEWLSKEKIIFDRR